MSDAEVEEVCRNARAHARIEGYLEGLRRGREEGMRELVLALLPGIFGPLDADALARVRSAEAGELVRWATRIAFVRRIDELWG